MSSRRVRRGRYRASRRLGRHSFRGASSSAALDTQPCDSLDSLGAANDDCRSPVARSRAIASQFHNDPSVAPTGRYDYGGDPAVAFRPNGIAYYACFGYQASAPYNVALLMSRSTDGGVTWLKGGASEPLTQVAVWQGNGISKGSTGQFPDHEVTSGSVRSDQDQRIVTDPRNGDGYLTVDNSIQGGKGTAMYVARSSDHGRTWSAPVRFGVFQNPECLFHSLASTSPGHRFAGPAHVGASVRSHARSPLCRRHGHRRRTGTRVPHLGRCERSYASSADGGATWTSQRVSRKSFDPAAYGVPSGSGVRPSIGDYTGIASLAHGAAMAWTGPGKTYGALPTNYETYFGSATP